MGEPPQHDQCSEREKSDQGERRMTPRSADDSPERDNPTKDVQEGYNDPVPVGQFAQFVHDVTPWRSPMT
jgi:hypothetical protein